MADSVADKRHAAAIAKGVTCPKATACPICWPRAPVSLQKGVREVVISDMLAALKTAERMIAREWPNGQAIIDIRLAIAAAETIGIRAALNGDA